MTTTENKKAWSRIKARRKFIGGKMSTLKERLLKPIIYNITAERCAQIADEIMSSGGWGSKSITKYEREQICNYWNILPGHTCFFDACIRLAQHLTTQEVKCTGYTG